MDLPQSVLRYWETVFPLFSPSKSAGGSRQYSDADVKMILRIKELLYKNGFTIKGANLQLGREQISGRPDTTNSVNFSSKVQQENVALKSQDDLILKLKKLIRILED